MEYPLPSSERKRLAGGVQSLETLAENVEFQDADLAAEMQQIVQELLPRIEQYSPTAQSVMKDAMKYAVQQALRRGNSTRANILDTARRREEVRSAISQYPIGASFTAEEIAKASGQPKGTVVIILAHNRAAFGLTHSPYPDSSYVRIGDFRENRSPRDDPNALKTLKGILEDQPRGQQVTLQELINLSGYTTRLYGFLREHAKELGIEAGYKGSLKAYTRVDR